MVDHVARAYGGRVLLRLLTITAVLALACDSGVGPSAVEPPPEVTLAPNQTARIAGTDVTIGFEGVREDSRCPVDVTCVWEGNAAVGLTLVQGSTRRTEILNTAIDPRFVDVGDVRLEIVNLSPRPHTERAIAPEDYRVTLSVK